MVEVDMPSLSLHKECFVCGSENTKGLGVKFFSNENNVVSAEFSFPSFLCGYPNRIQGGIISAVLDSAMANVLLNQNVLAYTAKMEVKFHHPVEPNTICQISAQQMNTRTPLYTMAAKLFQNGVLAASASAVFFQSTIKNADKI